MRIYYQGKSEYSDRRCALIEAHGKRDIEKSEKLYKLLTDAGYNVFMEGNTDEDEDSIYTTMDIPVSCMDEYTEFKKVYMALKKVL